MPLKFPVILADPPWPMRAQGSRMNPAYKGRGRKRGHYRLCTHRELELMAHGVRTFAAKDSFLFLWAPHVHVIEGLASWFARRAGFEPKQELVWIKVAKSGKPRFGGGSYTRLCTEPLLLCRRGRAVVQRHDIPNVFFAERTRHSAKPDASYELIEKLCKGPYLEIFARRRFSERWTAWGNQLS